MVSWKDIISKTRVAQIGQVCVLVLVHLRVCATRCFSGRAAMSECTCAKRKGADVRRSSPLVLTLIPTFSLVVAACLQHFPPNHNTFITSPFFQSQHIIISLCYFNPQSQHIIISLCYLIPSHSISCRIFYK